MPTLTFLILYSPINELNVFLINFHTDICEFKFPVIIQFSFFFPFTFVIEIIFYPVFIDLINSFFFKLNKFIEQSKLPLIKFDPSARSKMQVTAALCSLVNLW